MSFRVKMAYNRILWAIEQAKSGKLDESDKKRLIRLYQEIGAARDALKGKVEIPDPEKTEK